MCTEVGSVHRQFKRTVARGQTHRVCRRPIAQGAVRLFWSLQSSSYDLAGRTRASYSTFWGRLLCPQLPRTKGQYLEGNQCIGDHMGDQRIGQFSATLIHESIDQASQSAGEPATMHQPKQD